MQVKIFDLESEVDLEKEVNKFLKKQEEIISISYQTSHFECNGEQIFSFSCLILYENGK